MSQSIVKCQSLLNNVGSRLNTAGRTIIGRRLVVQKQRHRQYQSHAHRCIKAVGATRTIRTTSVDIVKVCKSNSTSISSTATVAKTQRRNFSSSSSISTTDLDNPLDVVGDPDPVSPCSSTTKSKKNSITEGREQVLSSLGIDADESSNVHDDDDQDHQEQDHDQIDHENSIVGSKILLHEKNEEFLKQIEKQEMEGGRMRARQLGVLHEDPNVDMRLLMENYTVASLASALRDREDVLQQCARYALDEDWASLQSTLRNYHPQYVLQRRVRKRQLDLRHSFDIGSLELIRKALSRMPRTVTQPHTSRAGVVVALCLDDGIPSVLFEKRSPKLRAHADEVCLPGGMVCSINDTTIVSTCLREMREEITGLFDHSVSVLGILRCNWGEVHHLVGVAVTPVVCYLGELPENLDPNPDEVSDAFTIPLSALADDDLWIHKDGFAPVFVGGKHYIWGLTGYILDRFVKDILLPHTMLDQQQNTTIREL